MSGALPDSETPREDFARLRLAESEARAPGGLGRAIYGGVDRKARGVGESRRRSVHHAR